MFQEKKTYLEMFLDNNVAPKQRKAYFKEKEEAAIIRYNTPDVDQRERNKLFEDTIGPAFKKTIYGVLEMRIFRRLPKGLNRETLIEDAFFRLVDKIYKFQPGMIGRSGQPVKAFSYFSTIAKHFILEQIARHKKILENKADVETSIDLSILSEETLEKISNSDVQEVVLDDYVGSFLLMKHQVVEIIKDLIAEEEGKDKRDEDFIKLGYCLKYLLEKWDKIEFMKKNEFMRILTLYTSFPQQKVSFLFKRYKTNVLKKIRPSALNKNKRKKVEIEEIDESLFIEEDAQFVEEALELNAIEIDEDAEETEEEKIQNYNIYSVEDYEAQQSKLENVKTRQEWLKRKQK